MDKDPFKKYLKESEPDKVSKGYAWSTAIGLQKFCRKPLFRFHRMNISLYIVNCFRAYTNMRVK